MQPQCKKCGRPLKDPTSIARGMGPECAGMVGGHRKSTHTRNQNGSGAACNMISTNHPTMPLFAWADTEASHGQVPDQFAGFPIGLLALVLSAPATGAIAVQVKRSKRKGQSPIVALKEIRRMCINLRMIFWPGVSAKGEPLACIPCGDDRWKIGQDGHPISASDLVAYLSRYGVI